VKGVICQIGAVKLASSRQAPVILFADDSADLEPIALQQALDCAEERTPGARPGVGARRIQAECPEGFDVRGFRMLLSPFLGPLAVLLPALDASPCVLGC